MAGVKSGRYHQGALRVSRFNPWEGYVGCEGVDGDILLSGRTALNRAFDGDVVAGAGADRLPGPSVSPTGAGGLGRERLM